MKLDLAKPSLSLRKPTLNLEKVSAQSPYKMENGQNVKRALASSATSKAQSLASKMTIL